MRKWLFAAIALALNSFHASAQNAPTLQNYQPGPRLIDGSQLNKMVGVVNSLTGHGGGITLKGYFSNQTSGSGFSTGPTAQTGTVIQGVGANSATARVELDSYAGVAIFSAIRRNGTKISPTAILSGDQLGSFNYHGASTTALTYGPAARMSAAATENWSSTAGGTKLTFSVTPNTTQVLTDAFMVDQDGGVKGIAAAQGTAINITGGTSSTSGNAGGAVTLTGGTPGATGVGGGITITSGAGGSTSGAAGAIAITAGTATSANGASVTITAGAANAGTNTGGSVNLVPGAAFSTGIPGTVQIAGDSNLVCTSFVTIGAPAAATDTAFFIANRSYLVTSVREIHAVAAGGASTLQLVKDTSTNAPGAGTDLLTNNTNTGFDLNATANTVQTGTLTATIATKTLAAGDRLSVDFANAIQSSSGITVTACMAPI